LCYASDTDPSHPHFYTRAGVDIVFRPDSRDRNPGKHAKSAPFFRSKDYMTEGELRRDAHKWETTLHATGGVDARKLHDPVFDIHYNARRAGANTMAAPEIPYAMIITIFAPEVPDLFNRIQARYRTHLEELRPVIELPVET